MLSCLSYIPSSLEVSRVFCKNLLNGLKYMEVAKLPKALSDYFSAIGRKGGQARVPKGPATLSPERRSEIARKAVQARWAKAKKKGKGK